MADNSLQAESVCANPDALSVAWDASNDLDTLALDIECAAALICMASRSSELGPHERMAIDGMANLVNDLHSKAEALSAKYEALGNELREAGGKVVAFPFGKGGDHGAD